MRNSLCTLLLVGLLAATLAGAPSRAAGAQPAMRGPTAKPVQHTPGAPWGPGPGTGNRVPLPSPLPGRTPSNPVVLPNTIDMNNWWRGGMYPVYNNWWNHWSSEWPNYPCCYPGARWPNYPWGIDPGYAGPGYLNL